MSLPAARPPVPETWRGRRCPYPRDGSVHSVWTARARDRPEAVALEDGHQRLSCRQLDDGARRFAGALALAGVQAGDRVGLILPRSVALVTAQLGVLMAGAVYVPLDPSDPSRRLSALLHQVDVRAVLAPPSLALDLGPTCARLDPDAAASTAPLSRAARRGGLDPAYVMFTSGSTGQPKAVLVPHRAILRLVLGNDFADLGPSQTWLHLAPPAFDAATLEIWAPLLGGGRCVVVDEAQPTLQQLGRSIAQHGATAAWLTASLFDIVVDEAPQILAPLHQLLIGGEVLSADHVRRALLAHPDLRLVNGYGPTEDTTFTCCHRITLADTAAAVPIGRPICNTTAHVVDDRGQPVAVGQEGELWAGGDGVALGYLGQPELTAERFVPDPWSKDPAARLYRTGDRVRWREDGVLEFLGRSDQQLKIHGHRIEPGEIEAALIQHPAIKRAAVVSEGRARLVAHIVVQAVASGAPPPDQAELARWLGARLPSWMVPSRTQVWPELPTTRTGKVDRRALVSTGPPTRPAQGGDPLTRTLLELLPAAAPDLSRGFLSRGFVELGGDSLLAMVLSARWARSPGVDVRATEILASGHIADLLDQLRTRSAGPQEEEEEPLGTQRSPRLPATREQTALWLEQRLARHPAAYNEAFAWRIDGPLDVARLRAALDLLVARHGALRTRLIEGPDGLEQHIAPPHAFPWSLDSATADSLLSQLGAAADQPFDLAVDAPCRALLLRLHDQRHALLLTFHHAVIDDWSLGILFEDLAAAWSGHSLPAVPATTDPAFAEARPEDRAWWREELAGCRLDLGLPAAPGPVTGPPGGVVPFVLPAPLAQALEARGAAQDATPFVVMLTLYLLLLARLAGRQDLAIATPFSQRSGLRDQARVGYHLQTLLVRARLSPRTDLDQAIQAVRRSVLGSLDHAGIGLSELLAATRAPGTQAALDRVEAVFVHRPAPGPTPALAGLAVTPLPLGPRPPKFDLTLWLDRVDQGYQGHVEHRRAAIADDAAAALALGFTGLAAALVDHPDADPLTVPVDLPGGRALPPLTDLQPIPADRRGALPPPPAEADPALVNRLCALWSRTLRDQQVGPDDDFFELGGDSVAAITLLARVQRDLGIDLGVRHVFEAPTPRSFARRLASADPSLDPHTSLGPDTVLLRPGVGRPVFCVGQPFLFRSLLSLVHGQRTLLGLDLPPPTGAQGSHDIAGLAAALVEQVLAAQPTGPVTLVGYSVGGNVAFEMACQLIQQGRGLDRLTLIDAFAPGAVRAGARSRRFSQHLRRGFAQGPTQGLGVLRRGLRRRLHWLRDAATERRGGRSTPHQDPSAAYDAHLRRALRAVRQWQPQHLQGDLTFIRAGRAHVAFEVLDEEGGWPPLVAGRLEVHHLDCDHLQVFEQPHIQELAALLDRLDSA